MAWQISISYLLLYRNLYLSFTYLSASILLYISNNIKETYSSLKDKIILLTFYYIKI